MTQTGLFGLGIGIGHALACIVAVAAAVTDFRSRTIPNRLTYSAFVAGLLLAMATGELRSALLGALVAGGGAYLLFIFRAIGGGDVKLLAALGMLLGLSHTLEMLFFGIVFGAAWAIFLLTMDGRMLQTVRETWHLAKSLIYPKVPLVAPAQGVEIAGGIVVAAATIWVVLSIVVTALLQG